jgi:hypothetical protein
MSSTTFANLKYVARLLSWIGKLISVTANDLQKQREPEFAAMLAESEKALNEKQDKRKKGAKCVFCLLSPLFLLTCIAGARRRRLVVASLKRKKMPSSLTMPAKWTVARRISLCLPKTLAVSLFSALIALSSTS